MVYQYYVQDQAHMQLVHRQILMRLRRTGARVAVRFLFLAREHRQFLANEGASFHGPNVRVDKFRLELTRRRSAMPRACQSLVHLIT